MDFNDDQHIDVCKNIEVGLCQQYEQNPGLTDGQCIFALDKSEERGDPFPVYPD